jgi:hypothetical protein
MKDLPLDLNLVFSAAMRAVIADDLTKAWPLVRQFLDHVREWDGPLEGQTVAASVQELLALLDNRLWMAHGEKWAEFIGVPIEEIPNPKMRSCALCRRTESQVKKLIAGGRFYICNECLAVCNEALDG